MRRIVATIAVSLVLLGAPVAAHGAAEGSTTGTTQARVLIIGDSVTQGRVGDYTWRYRLWKALRANRVAVDFVGPHTGLYDAAGADPYDNPGYADPGFDQDHAARWGALMPYFTDIAGLTPVQLVAAYQPDVVINDLGINDLIYTSTPAQLIDAMQQFVADVRSVNPGATVILGQLTQTWYHNGSGEPVVEHYNAMLDTLVAGLDQPGARVIAARRPADYVEYVDTYDPAHPSRSGEVKIAQQFSDVLLGLGLPTDPTPVTYSGRAQLSAAAARHRSARLRFTTPSGATKQAIWKRDVTAGGRWRLVTQVGPSTHRFRVTGLRHHHRYAFRLRAYQGALRSTAYSNRVRVRIR
jgi:lysophospholipase L1-like esterase